MSATPRLHVEADLAPGGRAELSGDQAHYISRVLRLGAGDRARLFNGRDGEVEGEIRLAGKTKVLVELSTRIREQAASPDVWLLFAPLKKARTDFLVEKATELGASELHPIFTTRTDADVVRVDRLTRIAIEAAEQTERLDIPRIHEGAPLQRALAVWDAGRPLFYADESGDEGDRPWGGDKGRARPIAEVVKAAGATRGAVLIGPEGGFTAEERDMLRGLPYVHAVGLGPRILRAETAAVAALTVWQSVAGDWR